jgi:hypothetical protein
MRIAFLLSSKGGSPLVVGLERGLTQLGHRVVPYGEDPDCDLIVIFNQCAHTTDYQYPEFPSKEIPIAFVDSAEYGYFKRLPNVINQYANAFAEGSLSHDTKNKGEQERLREFLRGKSFPYFLREYSKYVRFPKNYYPIDYPLYAYSDCLTRPQQFEYLHRDLELFVSWGASHPWRMNLTEVLRGCHTKCEIYVIGEESTPRMPQNLYFERTRAAKVSVSFDGYGSGSFRMHEVLVRTCLLMGPLSIHRSMPLIDGVHCLEYSVDTRDEEFLGTNIEEKLRILLDNPDFAYELYSNGYDHCRTYYTELATARYLIETVQSHDWSRPTTIELGV